MDRHRQGDPLAKNKQSGSQAGWALISGGVSTARVDAHRLHQLIKKVETLVNASEEKEHIYQVAGDLILAVPHLLERIEQQLDETGYALSLMGKAHLKDRLPVSSRARVDSTIEGSAAFGSPMLRSTAQRVALQWLKRNG
jgi:hypothetical protein